MPNKISLKNIKNLIAKCIKFGPFIPFSNLLLLYGGRFLSPSNLKDVQKKRDEIIERKIRKILKGFKPQWKGPAEKSTNKIWVLWFQGEENLPEIPALCIESIRKNSNGMEVVFLSKDNLSEYYEIPERIKCLHTKGRITNAQLSDIIRAGLLSKHGGIWMDATLLLTVPLAEEWKNKELFSIKLKPTGYFVSECRWTGFCFKMDNRNPLPHLLHAYLLEYWRRKSLLIDYFLIDYMIDIIIKDFPEINNRIKEIPYTNPDLYSLVPILPDTFDDNFYYQLTKNTSIFKLSWRRFDSKHLNENPKSYFKEIKKIISKK